MNEGTIIRLLKQLDIFLSRYKGDVLEDGLCGQSQRLMLHYILSHKEREICATDIHMAFGLSKASISAALKELCREGYVTMGADAKDDRKKKIVLTEKGLGEEAAIKESLSHTQELLLRGVSKEDQKVLERVLSRMVANMKELPRRTAGKEVDYGKNIIEASQRV